MHRRQFIKRGLVASTFLAGGLGALVPGIANADESGSFDYGGTRINIKVKQDGETYTAFFNDRYKDQTVRIRMEKGSISAFKGLGQKDGQTLKIGKDKVTLFDGQMLFQGADGSMKKFLLPPTKNVGPVVVIILIILIIIGKWPPKPKLVRYNGAEMLVGY